MAICKQPLAFDVVLMLSWLLMLITISVVFSMYPELKIKNCKKKSSTYFIFIHLHIIQYIIYTLLLPYFRFSNPDIKTEQEMNNT
jgi:hypothetical protein